MTEYALSAFGILAVVGLLSLFSYGSGRAESTVLAIICLFTLLSPIAGAVGSLDADNIFDKIEIPDTDIESGYDRIIEEAFADGICSAVADRFILNKENISVRLKNFDSKNMRADMIRVILSGRAALADSIAIEKYLNSLSLGECKVEIEIG